MLYFLVMTDFVHRNKGKTQFDHWGPGLPRPTEYRLQPAKLLYDLTIYRYFEYLFEM